MEITVDVTERRRAEATLESFFALSSLAVAIVGYDGSIKFLNRAVLQRSGFETEDLRNRPLLDLIHPDDRALVHAEFQRLLAGSGDIAFECRGMTKNRAIYWMLIAATALPDEDSIIAVAHDITERKLAQETLRRSQAELEIHAQKLARSNEELERFAYVASHDLQEPLRMVASFTELLASRYAGRLDETADRYINYAVDGAKRMQQLIVDLLCYSRVNSMDLDMQPIEFEAPVRTAVRNLETSIKESGASVQWDCLPTMPADQAQITQLFQNLIGNAIKFRGKDAPVVSVQAEKSGQHWQFAVSDNGIGIAAEHMENIFVVFQRLHARTEYPGNGIGLAICKRIIERQGGKIWVESQPERGSTFKFTLPLGDSGEPAAQARDGEKHESSEPALGEKVGAPA
jgi:PAS domain S-box-containing protein